MLNVRTAVFILYLPIVLAYQSSLKYVKECTKAPLPYHDKPCASLNVERYAGDNKRQLLKGNVTLRDHCPDCRFCLDVKKNPHSAKSVISFRDLECRSPLIRIMFQIVNMTVVTDTSDCVTTLGTYPFRDIDINMFDKGFANFPYRITGTYYYLFYLYDGKKMIHFCKELKAVISL